MVDEGNARRRYSLAATRPSADLANITSALSRNLLVLPTLIQRSGLLEEAFTRKELVKKPRLGFN